MSSTRVAETVWPWRTAQTAPPKKPAMSIRVKAPIEAAVMCTVASISYFGFKHVVAPCIIATLAALTLLGGLFMPPLYHALHRFFLRLGNGIAVAVTWILLVPFFFLCFPLARVILLLSRKDPLHRALEPQRASYWTAHEPVKDLERYQRQF